VTIDTLLGEKCPLCGTRNPLEIVYGLPSAEMFDAASAGRIALGGCSMDEECTAFRCRRDDCGMEWGHFDWSD
jgi:hypothetical protein